MEPRNEAGLAAGDLDLMLREEMGARWHGHGAAILVNDIAIREARPADLFEAEWFAIVLHEYGHVVDRGYWGERRNRLADKFIATDAARLSNRHCNERELTYEDFGNEVFAGHPPSWIRAVIHLHHRAKRRGKDLSLCRVVSPTYERLLGVSGFYAELLRGELDSCLDLPLAKVISRPSPAGFLELHRANFERFISHTTTETPMSIFDKVSGHIQRKRDKALADWNSLVTTLADGGKEPGLDRIAAVIEAHGKAPEDLRKDVDLLVKKREAAAAVALGKNCEAHRARLKTAADAIEAELATANQTAEERYSASMQPLLDELKGIEAQERRGRGASGLASTVNIDRGSRQRAEAASCVVDHCR